MPPKRNPLDQLPWRTRSETTFARLSSTPVGLSPAPTERPHVWESRGPRFTSGCKSSASHVPTSIYFPRRRVASQRGIDPPIDCHNPYISHQTYQRSPLQST